MSFNRILISLVLICSSTLVYAQQDIEREQARILQEQRDRLEQQRLDLLQQRSHEGADLSSDAAEASTSDDTCFDVHTIELNGAEAMSVDIQMMITAPYTDQCLGLAKINLLLKEVTEWYFAQGFVTSRAYVTGQNLATGKLSLTIIEGRIESIKSVQPENNISMTTAFPGLQGELLNLRDIEQGIEQINRLQSVDAKMDILPGSQPGLSKISVSSELKQPWQMRLSRDNSGQPSTGEHLNSLLLSIDNPTRRNDFVYISMQRDAKRSYEGKMSESLALHWDMPYGYWSIGLDASYFRYLSTVESFTGNFETSGKSISHSMSLDRVLYRDKDSKVRLNFQVKHRDNRNYIRDVKLGSSHSTGSAGLGLSYEKFFSGQLQLLTSLGYDHGLTSFGAPQDEDLVDDIGPKAQFEKYTLRFDLQKKKDIELFSLPVSLLMQSSLKLQYSPDQLYAEEQISIGSLYNVRGYKGSSIAGDVGGYLRNTLNLQWQPSWGGRWLKRVDVSLGFDIGAIRDKPQRISLNKFSRLRGWALGLALQSDDYAINIVYTRPINAPDFLNALEEQWHFTISFTI